MSKKLSVSVPDELYESVKKISEEKDMSMAKFIRHCIVVYVMVYNNKKNKSE